MPGFGPILGATLLVAAGDLAAFSQCGSPRRRGRGRERPVVDGKHRLLKPRPSALLTLVHPAVISTGAQR